MSVDPWGRWHHPDMVSPCMKGQAQKKRPETGGIIVHDRVLERTQLSCHDDEKDILISGEWPCVKYFTP